MSDSDADTETDITAAVDRQESVGLMEPMVVHDGSPHKAGLNDLVVELASRWMPGLFPEQP